MDFYGLWGHSTVVRRIGHKFQATIDCDENGLIEGEICDTAREAIASALEVAAKMYRS